MRERDRLSRFRRDRARRLRRDETLAERRFRRGLARIAVAGTHFRRQAPIGPYVVDFVCHGRKSIVELDGGQHAEPGGIEADRQRTCYLERRGYQVIRFWNNEVMANLDGCIELVSRALADRPPTSPLTGEVGVRSAPGGGDDRRAEGVAAPLPGAFGADPPRQGEGGSRPRSGDDA